MPDLGKIVVRIPPSPTGNLHIGTARTALFNYLFTKKHGGKVILRSEDTDTERSKKEFEENILEALEWLGIKYDGELVRQSERGEVYKKRLKTMLDNGSAYVSKEEPKEEGQRAEVIRFKNLNKKIAFDDLVRGQVEFDTTDLKDFVIAKSADEPLYHLAVVVDDAEFGVTHVIRGEDHISNTPRQILIQEALGFSRPVYAHIPLILATDRSKLSKRHGATAVTDYKERGYLPEAMVNYLALLGWNPGTDQEIFSMDELIEQFSLEKIQKGGAIFDEKKLDWVNKEHIKRLPPEVQKEMIFEKIKNEPYVLVVPDYSPENLIWRKSTKEETLKHLEEASKIIENGGNLMEYAERVGKGAVLWPVRYALTGAEASPDPFTILEFLGTEESLKRIKKAIIALKDEKQE
ncbi:MAG: glutamate--tRNA ligase [Candidatus Zambryskibacteria bacterium]|nr:glutamate--tRNA ligase [Candidatus Zambryskibacteria bacterium]